MCRDPLNRVSFKKVPTRLQPFFDSKNDKFFPWNLPTDLGRTIYFTLTVYFTLL